MKKHDVEEYGYGLVGIGQAGWDAMHSGLWLPEGSGVYDDEAGPITLFVTDVAAKARHGDGQKMAGAPAVPGYQGIFPLTDEATFLETLGQCWMVILLADTAEIADLPRLQRLAAQLKAQKVLTIGIFLCQATEDVAGMAPGFDTVVPLVQEPATPLQLVLAARGFIDAVAMGSLICVDFADIRLLLADAGLAHFATALAEGENRATLAACKVLEQLGSATLARASKVMFTVEVAAGNFRGMAEVEAVITALLAGFPAPDALSLVFGQLFDDALGSRMRVSLVLAYR